MVSVDYCFLWLQWSWMCMPRAEWASWAQAIGSVIALGIAIWVPFKLRAADVETRRQQDVTMASIVAAELRLLTIPVLGHLQTITESFPVIPEPARAALTVWESGLARLEHPTSAQILQLAAGDKWLARALNQAKHSLDGCRFNMRMQSGLLTDNPVSQDNWNKCLEQWQLLQGQVDTAYRQYRAAADGLTALVNIVD